MKAMKKVFATLLAVVMILGLVPAAFAADDGSITIKNAVKEQTYTLYKLFDATYVTAGEGEDAKTNVSYTFTKTNNNTDLYTALKEEDSVFTLTPSFTDADKYIVARKEGKSDEEVIAFVKSNLRNLGEPVKSEKATSETLTFNDLGYGYYFITTTTGTLVTIDSAIKDASVEDKNKTPEPDKKVQEDSKVTEDNDGFDEKNDADIGDTVKYKTTFKVEKGALNYVLHDKMSEGLTFDSQSVKVVVNGTELTQGTQYTLVTEPTDKCTFEIQFDQNYIASLAVGTKITVTYSAVVNENAKIYDSSDSENTVNTNDTWLKYGEKNDLGTTHKKTETYVYDLYIFKYAQNGENKQALEGAEFVLYKTVSGTNYYAKITNNKLTGWTTTKSDATTLTSDNDGEIHVEGLDADTYYLEETKAPDGYNLLTAPVEFKISGVTDATGESNSHGIVFVKSNGTYSATTNNTIEVENKTGSKLPSTGGIGTTIFYVIGGIMVVSAVVLLIVSKRRNNAE